MSWARALMVDLLDGKTVTFRPRGESMTPHIKSGQLVTVVPAAWHAVTVGDIVLCRVHGAAYLHLVKAMDPHRGVQIMNAKGRVNGWTQRVYGKLVRVED